MHVYTKAMEAITSVPFDLALLLHNIKSLLCMYKPQVSLPLAMMPFKIQNYNSSPEFGLENTNILSFIINVHAEAWCNVRKDFSFYSSCIIGPTISLMSPKKFLSIIEARDWSPTMLRELQPAYNHRFHLAQIKKKKNL